MADGTALSRGDRNRNDRLARLRVLLPTENAIVGIDLADDKQAAVVADHDSRVLARGSVRCRAWELGSVLDWAIERAHAAGFASVTVAREPTGHRWRVLDQLAAQRGLPLVCVQPLLVWRAHEAEDLTWDKSDLLTELPGRCGDRDVRGPAGLVGFPRRDQRRGCSAGVVRAGGAAGRVA